jgi:aryl-alcohol dehydrogenase-like predicted oxidoreductase
MIPIRPFGRHGFPVSLLALGGWHLGVPKTDAAAVKLAHAAIGAGITFLDNAWDYNDGLSEERMGKAIHDRRDQVFLMTKACTHGRDAKVAMRQLEQSLKRLRTDYLDLWQIHEVVWEDDPDKIFAPGGSAEAMLKAKEQGKVRYIGFTGHKSPAIHKRMLSQGFPWDAVQMPLNVHDAHWQSFEKEIVPICEEQGIAVVAMKSFADGQIFKAGSGITPQEALRYTMSLPVATVVSGMDRLEILNQNLEIARNSTPLSDEERERILAKTAPVAAGGDFETFKVTDSHEGEEGRHAHDYPQKYESAAD